MNKLIILFLSLLTFSCRNQPDKNETTRSHIDTTIQVDLQAPAGIDSSLNVADPNAETGTPIQYDKNFKAFTNFYTQFEKPSQIFTIKSNEEQIIKCKEGTEIAISSNSFITKSGKEVEGDVKIHVNEYY